MRKDSQRPECPPGVALEIHDAAWDWIEYGLHPGSCTELLLMGAYPTAQMHAHMLIRKDLIWKYHVDYFEALARGKYGLRACAKIRNARDERKKRV